MSALTPSSPYMHITKATARCICRTPARPAPPVAFDLGLRWTCTPRPIHNPYPMPATGHSQRRVVCVFLLDSGSGCATRQIRANQATMPRLPSSPSGFWLGPAHVMIPRTAYATSLCHACWFCSRRCHRSFEHFLIIMADVITRQMICTTPPMVNLVVAEVNMFFPNFGMYKPIKWDIF